MTPVPQRRSVIPAGAWILAVLAALAALTTMAVLFEHESMSAPFFLIPILGATALAGYILLIGYIYGDAKRRGMKYVAWTFLAALAPSAIGIILYFILRDPLQVHCTKCGCAVRPGFAYCPRCGVSMAATCLQCHRVAQPGWSHCAWCGAKL